MYPGGVIITVRDGGLNLPVEVAKRPLIVGVSSKGTANTLYWVNGSQNIVSELGRGPGPEMLAPIADSGGALFLKVAATTAGATGTPAVTRVGSSTGTISIGGIPSDAYKIRIKISSPGRFQYALDGYSNTEATGWSPEYLIPAGGTFALAGTADNGGALTVTFATGTGTSWDVGDVHRIDCTAPHYTTTDLTAAFSGLLTKLGSVRPTRIMFAGAAATASATATLLAAIAGHLDTLQAARRWCRAVADGGSLDTLENFKTAIASFTDDRVGVVYDPITTTSGCRIVSKIPFTGWAAPVVPFVNAVAERFAATELSESCARVASGPLRGVMAIGNDEVLNTQFTAEDRIITACRRDGQGGFFVTKPFIRSAPTSDFRTLQWGCVLDEICLIVNNELQKWIERNLRTLLDGTGFLAPEEASRIESMVNAALVEQLVRADNIEGEKGHVSGVAYTVTRTNDYLKTGEIQGFASAVPLRENEGSRVTVALTATLPTGG